MRERKSNGERAYERKKDRKRKRERERARAREREARERERVKPHLWGQVPHENGVIRRC